MRGMKRSVNLVEGGTLNLHCKPWGYPRPIVSWRRESGPLNVSDPRVTANNDSTLVIESVVLEDRDNYYCVLTTDVNETTYQAEKATLVRVKGVFFMYSSLSLKIPCLCCSVHRAHLWLI